MIQAIIMAAGKGTRMKSKTPKVAHKICGKTIIEHVISNLTNTNIDKIISILGYDRESIIPIIKDKSSIVIQEEQLGTGHALKCASNYFNDDGYLLVVNGDSPLISSDIYQDIIDLTKDNDMVVLSTKLTDKPYGRLIIKNNQLLEIIEHNECTNKQINIDIVNVGIYCFKTKLLKECIELLDNNNIKKEYYITDLVKIFNNKGYKVTNYNLIDKQQALGINTQYELSLANKYIQNLINIKHMNNGVTIIDYHNTYIDIDVQIDSDVVIYPNTYIYNGSIIKGFTTIYPGSYISNSYIGYHNNIENSKIIDSKLGNEINIGPYAHLRNKCIIHDKNRIGNFVEMKNTTFGYDSRCAHLTYLGDSEVGAKVNIGCGVVTVNYDGINKYKTTIKDGAFIGSNSNLIAPITIGTNSLVAAGSTLIKDVEDGDMGIARNQQKNLLGYGNKYKKKGTN